jgi:hypothetical protein
MAQDICDTEEPDLLPTDAAAHLAACHFRTELRGKDAADLFGESDTRTLADAEVASS